MPAQKQDLLNSHRGNPSESFSLGEPNKAKHSLNSTTAYTNGSTSFSSTQSSEVVLSTDRPLGRGLSISIKATILATIFGVLPVLAVGWVAYRSADDSITAQIAQEKLAEANQLSDQLSRFLQERLANVKTVASISNTITRYVGTTANVSTEQRAAAIEQTLTQELTTFVQEYRTYANIAVYDLQGNVLAQSQGSARELNQKEAPYFQQVLTTGQSVISEPIASTGVDGSEQFAIYVAAPIQDQTGKTTAIVAARVPVEFIGNAVLRTASLREGTTYRLVDSSGQIFQNLPNLDGTPLGAPLADVLPVFPTVDAQRQWQAWFTNEQLHAYAPIKGIENLNWSVVTSTEDSFAFIPQRQLLQAIALGTAITALIAAVLGAILAERFTRPIQRVAKTVEKLGQGDLDARILVRGNDELAILGWHVNQMAAQIQALLGTLHHNTEQLRQQNDVLATLARNEALIQGDAQEAAKAFTEAIAQTLNIERVGIWVYNTDRTGLTCLDQYEQSAKEHSVSKVLYATDASDYFRTLEFEPLIVAEDVRKHPATLALLDTESIAPNTTSILNVPIQIAGRVAGVIRCDQTQTKRDWQANEQTFVTSVANLASIALESEFLQQEVSHLLDVVSEVEEGDLTTQARVSDRTTGLVADTFNRLIERLTDVLTQVVLAARQVSQNANQQKAMAEVVATNTEQQAQAVNRVLQLTEQVEQAAQGSAEKVQATSASLETVQFTIEQGQNAITTLTQGIEILQEGTDRIVQQMKTLGEFVGLADQFVQDQSQIASLTQNLALNASLVAARASEQRDPKQFASVAREFDSIANQVSRLAQQTNEGLLALEQRSNQIHSVVSIIDANIQNLGGLVRGFTEGVDQSNQVFHDVQAVTGEAVSAGAAVTQASQAIAQAAQSAAQVAREIADLAIGTAELSQHSKDQSEQMDQLSNQLLKTIQFFQLPTVIIHPSSMQSSMQPRVDLSQAEAPTFDVDVNGTSDIRN